jgi:hypothetical protein
MTRKLNGKIPCKTHGRSKLILWFTSDKATLDVVVPHIVILLAQLEHPQLVVST